MFGADDTEGSKQRVAVITFDFLPNQYLLIHQNCAIRAENSVYTIWSLGSVKASFRK